MEKNQRQIARAALIVMAAFTVSRLLGLVRQTVFGIYFGTGIEMDAYVAAQRIPEAIFLVVAGGALGSAFIPLFTARLERDETAAAWRLASSIINLLLVVLVPLSLLFVLIAPWLVHAFVAPGAAGEVQLLTIRLMRIMLLSTAIFGVSGVVMGVLNAHQHFLLPAIAPILYNVALIGGALWGGLGGVGMYGPALGMLVGSLVHFLVQVPGLVKYGARYTPTLGLDDAGVRDVGKLMAPRVLGVAAWQVNMIVTNNLASGLGAGAISALEYAFRLMLLPQGIFAQAISTAAFPTFSAQAARGKVAELRTTLMATLRLVIAITLPASAGLIVLGRPLIAMMFQYGAFDPQATANVAWTLAMFALGLLAYAIVEVLARVFYALQDTWTPAWAAVLSVVLNMVLGVTLPWFFRPTRIPPYAGLALANAIATTAEMIILLILIHRRVGGFDVPAMLTFSTRVLLATLGMSAAVWVWLRVAPASVWIQGLVGMGIGVGVFAALALLLRIAELWQLVRIVIRRGGRE